MQDHLVRIGVLGQIGRFRALSDQRLARGINVICRTSRGLEYGKVLNHVEGDHQMPRTGNILRRATTEDHLLWARIEKNRKQAFDECQRLLDTNGSQAVLMDVELLFDGQGVFFYFLGDISSEVETLTDQLAGAYEQKVQLRQFADALATGCGPDCGTKDGGCSDGGCSSCSIAQACANVSSSP